MPHSNKHFDQYHSSYNSIWNYRFIGNTIVNIITDTYSQVSVLQDTIHYNSQSIYIFIYLSRLIQDPSRSLNEEQFLKAVYYYN